HVIAANNSGTFGDPNYILAGADRSYAVGNNNTVTTADTFVFGSNVNRLADGSNNTVGTVENSVYLGNGTEATEGVGSVGADGKGTLFTLNTDQVVGTAATTAGDTGTVSNATVGGVTYGTFAGATANGVVSVGAAGAERRIQNVAAGEISSTSTDAINGSQLYAVYDKAAKPVTFTANTNLDTANTSANYRANNGLERQLGDTLSVKGAETAIALTRNTDNAVTGNYSAKNIQTIVDDQGVQIQMAENPEFESMNITDGTNSTVITPTTITVGDKAGNADKPVTITSGDNGGIISNLTTTLPDVVTMNTTDGDGNPVNYTTNIVRPTIPASILTNAATLGDVLNAGWNLQENDGARDFVKPYDTVNFANGTGTTVNITSDGNVSTVKVDVDTAALTGDVNSNATTGVAEVPADQGDKLVNQTTVVNAINGSGWKTNSTTATGGANETVVNPGETVNFEAGKNMTVTQNITQVDGKDVITYTYATANNVTFDSVTIGGNNATNTAPITISTTPEGNNVISNLTTTLDDPTGKTEGKAPDNVTPTNAATLGDVLNAGWNLQENGTAKDLVSPYDTVNFVNGTGTVVNITSDGNVSKVRVDMNVSALTGDITNNANGTAGAGDNGNKLVNVTTVTDAINNAGWTAAVNQTGTGKATDNGGDKLVNPGDTVTMIAGDNMVITKEGLNYTIATKKDVSFDNVAAEKGLTIGSGNTSVNMTPTTSNVANGDISPAVNMNGATLTNMSSNLPNTTSVGDNPTTNAPLTAQQAADMANTSGSNAATLNDVLNVGWNLQENGQDKDFVKPYDTVNFTDGDNTKVVISTDGNTNGIKINVVTGSTTVDEAGRAQTADTNAVATVGDIVNSINNINWNVDSGKVSGSVKSDSSYEVTEASKVKAGDTIRYNAGNNIEISGSGKNVNIATSMTPTFTSVQLGNNSGPVISADKQGNVKVATADGKPTKITNVAPGEDANDAVNMSQLKGAVGNIYNSINKVDRTLRAGIAGSNAAATLPQVYIPGKSMVAASGGTFKGENAFAIGYSRASDNGKLILKVQGNANSQGDIGAGVGIGYQW
ncbi:MAG: YadA-like family protein, partial [[Pasteurella] aerogenes]|nr:YadA-like family protein [[Pasteurella] aerogenes]